MVRGCTVKRVSYTTEQMRVYTAERREHLRTELRELLGGRCARCGSTKELHFDHIDPATKLFAIANGLSRPRAVLLAEVAKCQLLCRPHHDEKSDLERPKGEQVATSKLTETDVLAIRSSTLPIRRLSALYGVSTFTIISVQKRRSWKHI